MAVPQGVKQLGWFVIIWAGGVGVILAIGFLIRLVLMPG
ncbi:hypothetical protein SAMN06295905_3507 [Devosia lucknowensis]|uniref:DUF2474 domain-containing protein n=1 Tax=Devosia lucknowensis TaxID=1096929 RepID=A0A1Y6G8X6_9HYPH|nr:DUF2474 domain-containing protein [Devosia lucknowensis]SMQ86204.1 hypothetical protein SAMN06295905_3507 [Devosia lucknowensis]